MKALDIATGGGHTALILGRRGAQVIASDLTAPMLRAARGHIAKQTDQPFDYVRHDAESLPFPDQYFDVVTCRIAPHHFPDVQRFVREAARVLKPGGQLGVVDIISPEQQKAARYCNLFERLRDPSHVWAYSLQDWEFYMDMAGLDVRHTETFGVPQQVGIWAVRVGCDDNTIHRLRAMLVQAPPAIQEWYQVPTYPRLTTLTDIEFRIRQGIIVGVKRPA